MFLKIDDHHSNPTLVVQVQEQTSKMKKVYMVSLVVVSDVSNLELRISSSSRSAHNSNPEKQKSRKTTKVKKKVCT